VEGQRCLIKARVGREGGSGERWGSDGRGIAEGRRCLGKRRERRGGGCGERWGSEVGGVPVGSERESPQFFGVKNLALWDSPCIVEVRHVFAGFPP
jgi:hypothetical protein